MQGKAPVEKRGLCSTCEGRIAAAAEARGAASTGKEGMPAFCPQFPASISLSAAIW